MNSKIKAIIFISVIIPFAVTIIMGLVFGLEWQHIQVSCIFNSMLALAINLIICQYE